MPVIGSFAQAIACNTIKLTDAGNIKDSPGVLCWINVSNTTGNGRKVTIHDDTDATADEIMQIAVPGDDSKFLLFSPAMPFSTGIRCGTVETELVITAGYL